MSVAQSTTVSTFHASCTSIELNAALLDGELVRVGDGYWWIDVPIGQRERARSLTTELGDARIIVCDRSAAWVWGWGPSPSTITTCVSISARVPSPVRRRLNTREVVISSDEVVVIAATRVTSPVRTLIDLVRHESSDEVIDIAVAALTRGDVDAHATVSELDRRPGIAHLRRARRRLETAISRC
jgi:hypothetical protein